MLLVQFFGIKVMEIKNLLIQVNYEDQFDRGVRSQSGFVRFGKRKIPGGFTHKMGKRPVPGGFANKMGKRVVCFVIYMYVNQSFLTLH